MCKGFSHLLAFPHHFVMIKLVISSSRVKGKKYFVPGDPLGVLQVLEYLEIHAICQKH